MKKKIIIVGAGMAGLTAAAYLCRSGHEVRILEKNSFCGGLVHTFERNGFYFDSGPRAIENSAIVIPLLKDLNISLQLQNSYVSTGIEDQIIHYNSTNSILKFKDSLDHLFPGSQKEIETIFKHIKSNTTSMQIINKIDNPFFKDLGKDLNYTLFELLPWFPGFLFTLLKFSMYAQPVEPFLERISSNTSLTDMLHQHYFKNTPIPFALGYYHTFLNYYYPDGGTGEIPKAIEDKILNEGGFIDREVEVQKIDTEQNKVTDQKGKEYFFDYLLWAADLKTFYKKINLDSLQGKRKIKFARQKNIFLQKRGSESAFNLFIAVNEKPESFKRISHGHFIYTPSKKGLGQLHRSQQNHFIENFSTYTKKEVLLWLQDFCRFNTYEISIPCLKDSHMAPEGKTGLNVSMLFDGRIFFKVKEAGWYDQFKSIIEKNIINTLNSSIYPFLKEKILFKFSSTPVTLNRIFGVSDGAIIGWSLEQEVPVPNTLFGVFKAVKTPFPHIFKAGQWVYSPAGVPTAILTGRLAASQISQKLR